MSAVILMDADDAAICRVLTVEDAADHDGTDLEDEDDWSENLVFETVAAADQWIERNARVGWCTRILEVQR